MKVHKILAVFTALLFTAACSVSSPLDEGINNAISGLGDTSGLTRYNFTQDYKDAEATNTTSIAFFINLDSPKEIKEAWSVIVSGTVQGLDTKEYVVDNQLMNENSLIYGNIAAETVPAGITADGYKFYKSTVTQSKGRQYDAATKQYKELSDNSANISKGQTVYFAIKDEGSQITVKTFSRNMPANQDDFDRSFVYVYKK